jgi:N-acetylmuramoyl-L-alanine amidase
MLTSCTAGSDSADLPTSKGTGSSPANEQSSATTSPSPTESSPQAPAPVVVIDPGHNGGNSGAPEVVNRPVPDGNGGTKPCNTVGSSTDAGYAEHTFNWAVALAVRDLLVAQGIEVVLTRPDDAGVGPCVDQRAGVSQQVGASAFVSIHADGSAAGDRGFHVITTTLEPAGPDVAAASDALALAVRDAMATVLAPSNYIGNDGLNARDDLAGLNLNLRPAVYLECGNMRDANDAALLSDPAGQAAIAQAVTTAVLAFLG